MNLIYLIINLIKNLIRFLINKVYPLECQQKNETNRLSFWNENPEYDLEIQIFRPYFN